MPDYSVHQLSAKHEAHELMAVGMHQFIAMDEARYPMGSDDSEADTVQHDADRSKNFIHARHFWYTR